MTVGTKPPSAVGAGSGAPAGWGWVAPYIGMIWPNGDSAKLRAAAAAWATAGANFMATETAAGGGTMAAIGAQQIPESAAINKALSDASEATMNVARQCQTIATQLNSYAAKVDKVHAAILDLLSRICDPLTGIKEVWDLLTDEDEDEIKRIADDIRMVVDNFAHEVETLGEQINATMTAAVAAAEDMGRWAGKEWDHFLHGTQVGRVLNHVGRTLKGFGVEGWHFVEDFAKFSPTRLQTDPMGFAKDAVDMVAGEAPLVGLGPDGGPGVGESWKALGKQVTHWDEWGKNPDEAFGETVFDVATFALPGGPLSKLGKLGRGLGDAVRGVRKPPLPDVPKPPSVKPPAEPPPAGPKPPESGPSAPPGKPEPGQPAPPASGKPAPGPADGPLPHSPTESKPPVGEKPPAGEPPKPTAAPPEPRRQAAGVRAGRTDAATPLETGRAGASPRAASSRRGAGSCARSQRRLPPEPATPAAPHLPTPPSVPNGRGALPKHLGWRWPHGGEPGGHPPEIASDPRGGPPHPVEGEGPPSDATPAEDTEPPSTKDTPSHNHEGDQLADSANQAPAHGEMPEASRQTISGHGSLRSR